LLNSSAPESGRSRQLPTLSAGGLVRRILIIIFLISLVGGAGGFYLVLRHRALQAAANQARLLLTTALAVSDYTNETIFPLLDKLPPDRFYEQLVPFHASQAVFRRLRKTYPAYSYREPALNPTSLDDQPTPFDVELTRRFRDDPKLQDLEGVRQDGGRTVFYLAKPIRLEDPKCLVCHSTPDRAPKSMVARYGTVNGFGWSIGETVGVQTLSVPIAEELRGTTELAITLAAGLMAIFFVTYVAITAALRTMLLRPLTALARAADDASVTNDAHVELPRAGVSEIQMLGNAIGRLRVSLRKALGHKSGEPPAPPT
jgi:HAMP domain-containing protein